MFMNKNRQAVPPAAIRAKQHWESYSPTIKPMSAKESMLLFRMAQILGGNDGVEKIGTEDALSKPAKKEKPKANPESQEDYCFRNITDGILNEAWKNANAQVPGVTGGAADFFYKSMLDYTLTYLPHRGSDEEIRASIEKNDIYSIRKNLFGYDAAETTVKYLSAFYDGIQDTRQDVGNYLDKLSKHARAKPYNQLLMAALDGTLLLVEKAAEPWVIFQKDNIS